MVECDRVSDLLVAPVVEVVVLLHASLVCSFEEVIVQLVAVARVFHMHGAAHTVNIVLGTCQGMGIRIRKE